MLRDLEVAVLVHDCLRFLMSLAAVGREVCRGAALVRKVGVGSRVVQLSVVEGLVEQLVKVGHLKTISQGSRANKRRVHTVCWTIE